jgi:two-component system sensor histidine kinase HydH
MPSLNINRLWQTTLLAIIVLQVCTLTAAILLSQQSSATRGLRASLDTRRAVEELEECLTDLVALEEAEVESVKVLQDRVPVLIRAVERVTTEPNERAQVEEMALAFSKYLRHWQELPPVTAPEHNTARRAATHELKNYVLKACQEFETHHIERLDQLTDAYERLLRRLSWTIAGIGTLGGVAGMALGYGVTRKLNRSIKQLRVQLRQAADKSGSDAEDILVIGEGEIGGLHSEVERLTERIEAIVTTLQQREREVLRSEQLAALGQLAAGIGHELRNPLTSVKLIVQTGVESGGLVAEDLRIVAGEICRMERTLQSFLDFARPPKLQRRPTLLVPLIREVVDLLHGRATQQRVEWKLEVDNPEITVSADREQLRQVFVNLALNALDAMPSGGTLTIRVYLAAGGLATVDVLDTGPGILPSQLPRLFQAFSSTKETGLGMGLVICKRIVEAHAGTLEAANIPGSGARFTLTLPVEQDHAKTLDR